ncbi:MAG: response regulator [Acidobacteriia bacterium]|nr:response regulator [Terriglobia bacterium]
MSLPVLIVEDNPADLDLLKLAFDAHGIVREIIALDDGDKAVRFLERLDSERPADLVVMDLNVPKRDGIELLTRFRTHPLFEDVPIVVFTSSESPAERSRAERLGVQAYLRKPMELDEFMALGATFKELLNRAG